jgi:hypothetical protein
LLLTYVTADKGLPFSHPLRKAPEGAERAPASIETTLGDGHTAHVAVFRRQTQSGGTS